MDRDDVDLWLLSTAAAPEPGAAGVLSPEERERAGRFLRAEDRSRFVTVRHAARVILGRELGVPPASVLIRYGLHGKPALDVGRGHAAPRFNVSHARDLALIAVARGREVGVDVERLRTAPEACRDLAERFFSTREAAALRALPPDDRVVAFHAAWTRKEAFLKAVGRGLTLPLDGFDVSLEPGEPARLLATRWDPAEAVRWSLTSLEVPSGYVAALAVEGHGWRLRRRLWER